MKSNSVALGSSVLLSARLPVLVLFAGIFIGTAAAQSTSKPVVILIGPPSSGKSTQAERIQKRYDFVLITREQLMQDVPSMLARQKQPEIRGVLEGLIHESLFRPRGTTAASIFRGPRSCDHRRTRRA
jgi:hypothetical protein